MQLLINNIVFSGLDAQRRLLSRAKVANRSSPDGQKSWFGWFVTISSNLASILMPCPCDSSTLAKTTRQGCPKDL